MAWLAPFFNAKLHFSSDPAKAMTLHPLTLPYWQAARPTPPAAADTNKVSPSYKSDPWKASPTV